MASSFSITRPLESLSAKAGRSNQFLDKSATINGEDSHDCRTLSFTSNLRFFMACVSSQGAVGLNTPRGFLALARIAPPERSHRLITGFLSQRAPKPSRMRWSGNSKALWSTRLPQPIPTLAGAIAGKSGPCVLRRSLPDPQAMSTFPLQAPIAMVPSLQRR